MNVTSSSKWIREPKYFCLQYHYNLNLLEGPMLLAGHCPVGKGMVTWVDLVGQKSTDCPLEATQTLIPIILQRKICVDMGSTRVALELWVIPWERTRKSKPRYCTETKSFTCLTLGISGQVWPLGTRERGRRATKLVSIRSADNLQSGEGH